MRRSIRARAWAFILGMSALQASFGGRCRGVLIISDIGVPTVFLVCSHSFPTGTPCDPQDFPNRTTLLSDSFCPTFNFHSFRKLCQREAPLYFELFPKENCEWLIKVTPCNKNKSFGCTPLTS